MSASSKLLTPYARVRQRYLEQAERRTNEISRTNKHRNNERPVNIQARSYTARRNENGKRASRQLRNTTYVCRLARNDDFHFKSQTPSAPGSTSACAGSKHGKYLHMQCC